MSDVIFQPKSGEVALGTSTGAASDINGAEFVRLHNTAAAGTEHLVTLNTSDGTDIGTFSLDGLDTVIIQKEPSDKVHAANAAVLVCGVRVVDGGTLLRAHSRCQR